MTGNYRFFFKDSQGNVGKPAGEFKPCRQTDDTCTDNCNINWRRDGGFSP
jgi:hypothetical protein